MKRISLLITILTIYSLNITFAQAPGIAWQNTIGGNNMDYVNSIQQTADGGYILGGYTYSGISGDKTEASQGYNDYWVVKLDATGQTIEWQNTIGGSSFEQLYSIKQTADGGYILGGFSHSGISGDKTEASQESFDYWVVKLDGAGNIVWQNTIGGSNHDYMYSIQQTADGGYILGGDSKSEATGDKTEASQGSVDYWVVKLDATGQTIEWQNTIGGSDGDLLYSIQQTTDGGYILGGWSASGISGDKTEANQGGADYWVVKLDGAGNIVWQNTIGGSADDYLRSISQTIDGGYIFGGYSKSGKSGDKTEASQGDLDYWVVKLNGTGQTIEWQNTIGGSNNDKLESIYQTTDGGYILGGWSESEVSTDKTEASKGGYDYWIVKITGVGNIYWQKTIGGSDDDYLYSVQQTSDGGYVLGGRSRSEISGDKTEAVIGQGTTDYWVVKLEADAPLAVEQTPLTAVVEDFIVLPAYPNPFNPSTTIRYGLTGDSKVTIEIYDITGKLISSLLETYQTQGWHSVIWNGTNRHGEQVPAGLYLSRIISNDKVKTTKLMLLK